MLVTIFKQKECIRTLLQIAADGKLNALLAKGAAYESLPWSAFSG